ncbi:MAG: hypothetical protein RLZZ618_864 [Pseudomonadota bacterium]|jgi:spore germination protein YaaH
MKKILLTALLGAALAAQAQSTPPAAPAAAPVAAPSAAKKELLNRLMVLQQPALEGMARNLAEQPARQMMAAAEQAMQRVPEEKREATAKQIETLARKYIEEAGPIAKEKATKVGQSALAPMFNDRFTEDELRQLLVALDSPAYKKYQQNLPEVSNGYLQQLVGEMRPALDPKLKSLETSVAAALGVPAQGAEAPKAGKPAAAPKAKK